MRKLKNEELNRLNINEYKNVAKNPVMLVLDNVRSLNNIGSIFRTADAFRIEGIYLCGITGTPPDREIHKTALGATESVNWKYFHNTMEAVIELKKANYMIISVEQTENSKKLNKYIADDNRKFALILGHEIHGVDQEIINISDISLEIPQFGTKHSFNIVVSVGIVLWDLLNKIKKL